MTVNGMRWLVSNLLAYRLETGDIAGAAALKKVSPVAWQHINLYGRYEFTKSGEVIDIEEIIRALAKRRIREPMPA